MILGYILVFTMLGSVASLLGSFFILVKKRPTESFSAKLVNFAAGVLIAVAFLELLPEALKMSGGNNIFLPALTGFIGFFFAERFIQLFHHHHGHGESPSTLLVIIGDGVHNFIDGVAISASFLTNTGLGITTSLAVAAHEIPQEIADMAILISNRLSPKKALIYNFASALTALAGALLAFAFAEVVSEFNYIFLSITAGFFIYICASDLIPQLHEKYLEDKKFNQILIFLLGIFSVAVFSTIFDS